jgi:hypothetical protein
LRSVVDLTIAQWLFIIRSDPCNQQDITYRIHIRIDPEPTPIATGMPPTAEDFVLTGKTIELERAYRIQFNLVAAAGEDEIPNYFVGYFNASPQRTVASVTSRRRKATPMEMDES